MEWRFDEEDEFGARSDLSSGEAEVIWLIKPSRVNADLQTNMAAG